MSDSSEPGTGAPVREDQRYDDLEYNPALEPQKAKAWLNLIRESEQAFQFWNDRCDNIEKMYANCERVADQARPKEYQMLWANLETLKPIVYAKAPVPVVVPKFMDRRPVYQAASEVLERTCTVAFDLAGIDELMKLVRDDLTLFDRGVAWVRYEAAGEASQERAGNDYGSDYDSERVCIDFKLRGDFVHSISRNWREVTWVAGASYLTRAQARERFKQYSGDEYQDADYQVDKDAKEVGGADERERAKFWEVWDKGSRRVVWVAEGCEYILDEADPIVDFREFFPCPKPCYGTVQRSSLVPVPDVLQYRDQLDEINTLTARIHALSDAVVCRGFYPAGGSEMAEAVQAAVAANTPGTMLVPISNWAAFGGTKDVVVWLPIQDIANTITALVALRQQIVQDIYQLTGLSDIMRGDTDPNETLGAQQIKTQYGNVRIRDKQQEMVRFARDLVELTSEVILDKFKDATIVRMSQTQLPTNKMVEHQIGDIQNQMQQLQQNISHVAQLPQARMMTQQNPQAMQQAASEAQQTLQMGQSKQLKLQQTATIDQVLDFLHDNRARAFVLDIETDSTIIPDEQAEKQSRAEFLAMLSQLLPQLAQMVASEPQTAGFCGELLKFSVGPYRAGRSMDGAINELVELLKAKSGQPQAPDPTTAQNQAAVQIEQMKVQSQQQIESAKLQLEGQKLAMTDRHKQMDLMNQRQIAQMKVGGEQQADQMELQIQQQKAQESEQAHQLSMAKGQQDMQLAREKADLEVQQNNARNAHMERQMQMKQAAQQFQQANKPPQGL